MILSYHKFMRHIQCYDKTHPTEAMLQRKVINLLWAGNIQISPNNSLCKDNMQRRIETCVHTCTLIYESYRSCGKFWINHQKIHYFKQVTLMTIPIQYLVSSPAGLALHCLVTIVHFLDSGSSNLANQV